MKIIKTNYSELKAAADSYMILFEFGFFVNINFKSIGTIFSFFYVINCKTIEQRKKCFKISWLLCLIDEIPYKIKIHLTVHFNFHHDEHEVKIKFIRNPVRYLLIEWQIKKYFRFKNFEFRIKFMVFSFENTNHFYWWKKIKFNFRN